MHFQYSENPAANTEQIHCFKVEVSYGHGLRPKTKPKNMKVLFEIRKEKKNTQRIKVNWVLSWDLDIAVMF